MGYSPDVNGNPLVAHYTTEHHDFGGLIVPTRRHVLLRDEKGTADQSFCAILPDISDVPAHQLSPWDPGADRQGGFPTLGASTGSVRLRLAGEAFQPGFVFHVAADGSVRQVAGDIAFPNGMAVTADNSTLVVADSYRHQLVATDLSGRGFGAVSGCGTAVSLSGSRMMSITVIRPLSMVSETTLSALSASRMTSPGLTRNP